MPVSHWTCCFFVVVAFFFFFSFFFFFFVLFFFNVRATLYCHRETRGINVVPTKEQDNAIFGWKLYHVVDKSMGLPSPHTCPLNFILYTEIYWVHIINLITPEFLKWALPSLNLDVSMMQIGLSVLNQKQNCNQCWYSYEPSHLDRHCLHKHSWLSLFRPRLSRITAYLEVKIWSLPKHENLQQVKKILWKRGEIAPKEQFLLFSTIFSIYLTSRVQLHIYLLNVVVRIIFFSILQIWYDEVRISRSITESPLEFEITRVDCICFGLQSWKGIVSITDGFVNKSM